MDPLEQLTRDWDLRIAQAEDDQKMELRLQKAEAIAAFHAGESARKDRQAWVVEALRDNPSARPGEIGGGTRDEIMASAKASHDAIEALIAERTAPAQQAAIEQAAGQAWGGATASGATPPPPAEVSSMEDVYAGLREANPERSRQLSEAPVSPILERLGKAKAEDGLAEFRMNGEWDLIENYVDRTGRAPSLPPSNPRA